MSALFNLPTSANACRARLEALADEMASIRTEASIADIHRQGARQALDAERFLQTKKALQTKRHEARAVKAHLDTLSIQSPTRAGREGFRDALIEVLRLYCGEPLWGRLVREARDLNQAREASHG